MLQDIELFDNEDILKGGSVSSSVSGAGPSVSKKAYLLTGLVFQGKRLRDYVLM